MRGFIIMCRVIAMWLIIAVWLARFAYYICEAAILIPFRIVRLIVRRLKYGSW